MVLVVYWAWGREDVVVRVGHCLYKGYLFENDVGTEVWYRQKSEIRKTTENDFSKYCFSLRIQIIYVFSYDKVPGTH